MSRYAIVVAGGKGLRMGGDTPKQFLPVGGVPVLMRTLMRFREAVPDVRIVLVLPSSQMSYWRSLCEEYAFTMPYAVVEGGHTRFHSVKNGLAGLMGPIGLMSPISLVSPMSTIGPVRLVAVHDGVRPFVSAEVIRRCYDEAARSGTAVPVVPVVETVRELTGGGSRTVDRTNFRRVQTPQTFRLDILSRAYEQPYSDAFTDDASVVEAAGFPITLVDGNRENIKITTPFDLAVASALTEEPPIGEKNSQP